MILLIDNYDSFTYNLVHYLAELGGEIEVVRNDALTVAQIAAKAPQAIVLSPGPCTPNEAGVCLDVIRALGSETPILGVCLGHQAIGQAYGGRVVRAPAVMHGKTSAILHHSQSVFAGLPSPFTATRYHSLIIEETSMPAELEVTARTQDGLIMGVKHRSDPVHGVQFHPESIATEHGHAMLANFMSLAGLKPKVLA
jgi:anthranilate synthase component II